MDIPEDSPADIPAERPVDISVDRLPITIPVDCLAYVVDPGNPVGGLTKGESPMAAPAEAFSSSCTIGTSQSKLEKLSSYSLIVDEYWLASAMDEVRADGLGKDSLTQLHLQMEMPLVEMKSVVVIGIFVFLREVCVVSDLAW